MAWVTRWRWPSGAGAADLGEVEALGLEAGAAPRLGGQLGPPGRHRRPRGAAGRR